MKSSLFTATMVSLLFLTSCQENAPTSPVSAVHTGEVVASPTLQDATSANWSQAKFSHEDVDFFIPSDKKISLPENIDANVLFLKPSLQGENTLVRHFIFALDGSRFQIPIHVSFDSAKTDFNADFWLWMISWGRDIFATLQNDLIDIPNSESVDNPTFFTALKIPNPSGKVEKMWKFSSPENREMQTEMKYYNAMNYNTLADKIVIDVSEIWDSAYWERFSAVIQFPIYPLGGISNETQWILPQEVRVITKTGETIALQKHTDAEIYQRIGSNEMDYAYKCTNSVDMYGYAKSCHLFTSSAQWFKNLAIIEVDYLPEDIEKVRNSAKLANFALFSPDWYANEDNRAERKGIFYHPKLPFTLPQKPKDDEAVLVVDAKNLHKTSYISSVSWWFYASDGIWSVNLDTFSRDDDAKLQIDTFFFFPGARKPFLTAIMDFLWHGAIKWKVKYLEEPSEYEKENYDERRMEEIFIAKEWDFYHTQTEQKPESFSQQIYDSPLNEASSVKTFIFDLSRIKDMWQAENTEYEQAIEFLVEVPYSEQNLYKPQNAVITFHDGKTQELSLENNIEKVLGDLKKQGLIFGKMDEYHMQAPIQYVVRISPEYAKNVSRIEMRFE